MVLGGVIVGSATDKILDQIRAMLAKDTSRGATEAEAATALAMARRLMERHGLDIADVEAGSSGPEWVTDTAWESGGLKIDPGASFIGAILSRYFRVRAFTLRKGPPDFGVAVQLFGDRADVEVAKWVYSYLAGTYMHLWLEHRVRTKARKDRQRAFYAGLTSGLNSRLAAERRTDEAAEAGPKGEGDRKAIAVLGDRLERAFTEAHPDMGKARRSTFSDTATMRAGHDAGRSINVARPIGEGGPKGLPAPR